MTDKRFRVTIGNENDVRLVDYEDNTQLLTISFKEHKDAVDCRDALLYQCNLMNELAEENQDLHKKEVELGQNYLRLLEENEQLKTQLSEAKADEKQLGISFMGYKMKLIEVLRKKYDKVKGKTLYADVYTEIAEEMGVDLE